MADMTEITEHCEKLMGVAVNQVKFAIADCLRHALADLNVPSEHESHGIIRTELHRRIKELLGD